MAVITGKQIHALYVDEMIRQGTPAVNTRKNPFLNEALARYAREHNCSYDDAIIVARTGREDR